MADNKGLIILGIVVLAILAINFGPKLLGTQSLMNSNSVGDPDAWKLPVKGVQFGNSLMTVIGGATCSINPDRGGDIAISSGGTCYTNSGHAGLAFQLFRINANGGYTYIGEKQLLNGITGCFEGLAAGNYHWDVYFCDSTNTRTCTDSDNDGTSSSSQNLNLKGTVSVTSNGQTSTYPDTCDGANVLERYCDVDNSLNSVSKSCGTGKTCSNGACGTCTASCTGKCGGSNGCGGTCPSDCGQGSCAACTCAGTAPSCTTTDGCAGTKQCVGTAWTGGCVKIDSNCGGGSTTRLEACTTDANCATGKEVCQMTGSFGRVCFDLSLDECSIECNSIKSNGYCSKTECSAFKCYYSNNNGDWFGNINADECRNCLPGASKLATEQITSASTICCSGEASGNICTFGQNLKTKDTYKVPGIVSSLSNLNEAKTMTSTELAKYACGEKEDCKGENASCIKMSYLINNAYVEKATTDQLFSKINNAVSQAAFGVAGGASAGIAMCGILAIALAVPSAGASITLPAICGTIIAISAGTGGVISGSAALNVDKFATAVKATDLEGVGVCVATSGGGGGGADIMAWLVQTSILSGIPNWAIVLAGFVILMLLIKR